MLYYELKFKKDDPIIFMIRKSHFVLRLSRVIISFIFYQLTIFAFIISFLLKKSANFSLLFNPTTSHQYFIRPSHLKNLNIVSLLAMSFSSSKFTFPGAYQSITFQFKCEISAYLGVHSWVPRYQFFASSIHISFFLILNF